MKTCKHFALRAYLASKRNRAKQDCEQNNTVHIDLANFSLAEMRNYFTRVRTLGLPENGVFGESQ